MSPWRSPGLVVVVVLLVTTAGCFDLSVPPGSLRCVDRCPDGMECIGGLCYPEGYQPGVDAALSDADAALADLPSLEGAPTDLDPDWPFADWKYRKTISIDKSMFEGSDVDFPLWIRPLSDPDLVAHARTDGADILFALPGGTKKLDHEIETYKDGTLHAWVKLPSYTDTADTVLLMYYGNPKAESLENPKEVWSNGYEAVWHMATSPTQSVHDSTGRHHGTSSGQMTADDLVEGRLGPGIEFDGVDDRLDVGSFDVMGSGLVLEAWFLTNKKQGRLIAKSKGTATTDHVWLLNVGHVDQGKYQADFRLKTQGKPVVQTLVPQGIMSDTFTYLAANYVGTIGQMQLYINGGKFGQEPQSGPVATDPGVKVTIGNSADGARPFRGRIEEVRVSRVWRMNTWFASQTRNHFNPPKYISWGSEEPRPY
jgi:hypothetical protein